MNKSLRSRALATLLCASLIQTAETKTYHHHVDCGDLFCIGVGIAAIGAGIAAACGAFTWSDADILKWARQGVDDASIKYTQLNHHTGPILAKLQLFGNRNAACWSMWDSDLAKVAKEYPGLAPLHNTLAIMHYDLQQLRKIHAELVKRNLLNHPVCQRFYQELVDLIKMLDQLSDVILSASEYTAEEQALHQKLHHLQKERADRERNEALEAQARAAREQAQAARENNRIQERKEAREHCSQDQDVYIIWN